MASNYTKHYGLCQWEETDGVLRTDFNEDNQKIDAALNTNQTAISKEVSERKAAITAEQQARQTAITTEQQARTAVSNALAQEVQTRQAQVDALTEYTKIHLLKTATAQESADNLTLSLADVDWSQWRLVHIVATAKVSSGHSSFFTLSGIGQVATVGNNRTCHTVLVVWNQPESLVRGFSMVNEGTNFMFTSSYQNISDVMVTKIFDGNPILAGTTISVYGEK